MCGLAGVVTSSYDVARPRFDLSHRGPDGETWLRVGEDDWSGHLYHSRLTINDLTDAGKQPMRSRCGSGVVLCFNGEIYNSPDLRRECEARGHRFQSDMDGEVILHLYEDFGVRAFERLNGIFAISIMEASGKLVLARDAIGVKPLFYRELEGGVAFASEPQELRHEFGETTWDVRALAAFLTFLWVPAPWTAFTEIRALRPGEVLQWHPGARQPLISTGSHALAVPQELEPVKSPARAGTEVGELLDRAVSRQLLSDVPIGLMASGGTDSTLIWHSCREIADVGFTIRETAGIEGLDADAQAASRYASDYGLRHRMLEPAANVLDDFAATGDLLADPAFSLTKSISAKARMTGVPVLFSGQGADEVMGGYRRHSAAVALDRFPDKATQLAARVARRSRHPIRAEYGRRLYTAATCVDPFKRYSHLYRYANADTRARILDVPVSEVSDDVVFSEHRNAWEDLPRSWAFSKKAITLDLMVYLPGLGLSYVDRASMSQGVEIRVPWLDHDLVAWSLAQSESSLVGVRQRKIPARWLSEHRLPAYIWDRPKAGFAVAAERLLQEDERTQSQRHAGYIRQCVWALGRLGFDGPHLYQEALPSR